ncbi:MAG: SPFH domain-containing protein [Planctomycetota bacterium]|jgi:regulator of protease activity HflC (stomatin/prohibitin superfamily)
MAMPLDNIIGTLLNNLVNLLPFRIIHDYEQAVRFTFGHAGPTIRGKKRGWCLFVPLFQRVIIVDATWGQVLFDAQTIQTQDKIPLSVSGATIYRISDARSYLLSVFDTDAAAVLRAVAKGVIASILMSKTYDDIYSDKEGIQEQIVDRFRQEIEGWGVEVSKVHLHDLIQTRNIRLHGLTQQMAPENW